MKFFDITFLSMQFLVSNKIIFFELFIFKLLITSVSVATTIQSVFLTECCKLLIKFKKPLVKICRMLLLCNVASRRVAPRVLASFRQKNSRRWMSSGGSEGSSDSNQQEMV